MMITGKRAFPRLAAVALAALAGCGEDGRPPDDGAGDRSVTDAGVDADAAVDGGEAAPPADSGAPSDLPALDGSAPADVVADAGAPEHAPDAPPSTGNSWIRLPTPGMPRADFLTVDGAGNVFVGQHAAFPGAFFDERDRISPGVFRSRDGGGTWDPAARGLTSYGFTDLLAAGDLLLAGANALMASRDAGATWFTLQPFDRTPIVVGGAGALIIAGTGDFGASRLVRSSDGGMTFQPLTLRQPASEIRTIAVRDQLVLIGHREGIQRSLDGGLNFEPVVIPPVAPATVMGGIARIAIADDRVVLAISARRLIRSEDAGLSWQLIAHDNDPTVQVQALAAGTAGELLLGGHRGNQDASVAVLWRSGDGGKTWQALSPQPAASARAVAISRGVLLAGTELGVQRSVDGGKTWQWSPGPGGAVPARSLTRRIGALAVDRSATALGPDGDLYLHDGLALSRSSDGGVTYARLPFPGRGGPCHVTGSGALLCGAHRSNDHGASWVEMQFIGQATITRFAGAGPTLYAVANGRPWRSDDDGVSWTALTVTGSSPGTSGDNLAVDSTGAVYYLTRRSRDKGATWEEIQHAVGYVDHQDRLYEIGREYLLSSRDGITWLPPAHLPIASRARLGPLIVLPDDRIFVQVDQGAFGVRAGAEVLGDAVFSISLTTPPEPPPHVDVPLFVRADDGLEQAVVGEFARDRRGRIYAATNGGLYRFGQ